MMDYIICDLCGEDYTNSNQQGGILFGSRAICPTCTPETLKVIRKYKEERYIKAFCPAELSFSAFVRQIRIDQVRALL